MCTTRHLWFCIARDSATQAQANRYMLPHEFMRGGPRTMAFIRPTAPRGAAKYHGTTICTRPRRSAPRMTATPATMPQTDGTATRFGAAAGGEWFGVECFFSAADGAAETIHERYVPDAYREWGVAIDHFETVCSVRAGNFQLRRLRALPSVGCEADAVAVEEGPVVRGVDAAWGDGSFVAGRMVCVAGPGGVRRRVRAECAPASRTVSVTREGWEGPYCDAAVLPGCGGALESFAREPRDATMLDGAWRVRDDGGAARVVRREGLGPRLALPRGVTVEPVCLDGVGWRIRELGWLCEGVRTVVSCEYNASGEVVASQWRTEERVE